MQLMNIIYYPKRKHETQCFPRKSSSRAGSGGVFYDLKLLATCVPWSMQMDRRWIISEFSLNLDVTFCGLLVAESITIRAKNCLSLVTL